MTKRLRRERFCDSFLSPLVLVCLGEHGMQGLGMRGCLSPWSFASSAHLLLKSGAAQLTMSGRWLGRGHVQLLGLKRLILYASICVSSEHSFPYLPLFFFFQLIRGHHDQHDEMHMVMGTRTPQLQP